MFGVPLLIGACASALTLIVVIITGLILTRGKPKRIGWLWKQVAPSVTWNASDSWATNIAVGGTLFVGLATASADFLGKIVPSYDPNDLTALFLLLGASAAVAPLAYGSLAFATGGSDDNDTATGTVAGLIIASAFTLFAVFGQIGAISMAVYLSVASTAAQKLLLAGIGFTTALAIIYAVRSIVHLAGDRASVAAGVTSKALLGSGRHSSALL
jgi:hypothetical protein